MALSGSLNELAEKVSEVSEVVFFILGAMTIVEIVDAHQGFKVITDKINSKSKRGLMWVVGTLTFFMSAILDNLTTTIVMVSLVKKLLPNPMDRKLFGAMIVIAGTQKYSELLTFSKILLEVILFLKSTITIVVELLICYSCTQHLVFESR